MARSRFTSQIVPTDATQKVGHRWISYTEIGPEAIATAADLGTWRGINCATTEVLVWTGPWPHDIDVTQAITLTPHVVFDLVSDDDVFELDVTYEVDDGTTDPVHVDPATTTGVTDAAALTIVEATHESRRVSTVLAASIAAGTFAAADQAKYLSLGWTVTLTTMIQAEFIILGVDMAYTRRFV